MYLTSILTHEAYESSILEEHNGYCWETWSLFFFSTVKTINLIAALELLDVNKKNTECVTF